VRLAALCIGLLWSATLAASHSYGGLDLCALYPEVMPPGIEPAELPQPDGPGARLLQTYCQQCHALPGPGRHTAKQWREVYERMLVLMQVAARFRGMLGQVDAPDEQEAKSLRAYLAQNALRAMRDEPDGFGAGAYKEHCGNCHALPDPAMHGAGQWPAVLLRMQRNMKTMQYAPPSREVMLNIAYYLQKYAYEQAPSDGTGALHAGGVQDGVSGVDARSPAQGRRWLALGPFLLLMALGLARWWHGKHQ